MKDGPLHIMGKWVKGEGAPLISTNPASAKTLWQGHAASVQQVDQAIQSARQAFESWKQISLEDRIAILEKYIENLKKCKQEMPLLINFL